jgi:hypothetical protein
MKSENGKPSIPEAEEDAEKNRLKKLYSYDLLDTNPETCCRMPSSLPGQAVPSG